MSLSSQFQIASHSLPSSEQIQLGGVNSIRGYPEGDYLADTGGNLNVDWVFPMYLIPENWKLPNSNEQLRRQIEPVIFTDLGGGKLKSVLAGERRDKFMMGVGAGVRFRLYGKSYIRLDWANRVGDRPVQGNGNSTFHFTFQSEL